MNLRGLYPIAEVPVPQDGDKREVANIWQKEDDNEDDKLIEIL